MDGRPKEKHRSGGRKSIDGMEGGTYKSRAVARRLDWTNEERTLGKQASG